MCVCVCLTINFSLHFRSTTGVSRSADDDESDSDNIPLSKLKGPFTQTKTLSSPLLSFITPKDRSNVAAPAAVARASGTASRYDKDNDVRKSNDDDGNAAARHMQSLLPGTTAFITPSTAAVAATK